MLMYKPTRKYVWMDVGPMPKPEPKVTTWEQEKKLLDQWEERQAQSKALPVAEPIVKPRYDGGPKIDDFVCAQQMTDTSQNIITWNRKPAEYNESLIDAAAKKIRGVAERKRLVTKWADTPLMNNKIDEEVQKTLAEARRLIAKSGEHNLPDREDKLSKAVEWAENDARLLFPHVAKAEAQARAQINIPETDLSHLSAENQAKFKQQVDEVAQIMFAKGKGIKSFDIQLQSEPVFQKRMSMDPLQDVQMRFNRVCMADTTDNQEHIKVLQKAIDDLEEKILKKNAPVDPADPATPKQQTYFYKINPLPKDLKIDANSNVAFAPSDQEVDAFCEAHRAEAQTPVCDCGGAKARTTHSEWCSVSDRSLSQGLFTKST